MRGTPTAETPGSRSEQMLRRVDELGLKMRPRQLSRLVELDQISALFQSVYLECVKTPR